MPRQSKGSRFHAASPGHCRTALNGFRGMKDPLDGAKVVVVELALVEKREVCE